MILIGILTYSLLFSVTSTLKASGLKWKHLLYKHEMLGKKVLRMTNEKKVLKNGSVPSFLHLGILNYSPRHVSKTG